MSEENKKKSRKKEKKKKISVFRLIIVIIFMVLFIGAGAVGGLVLATVKNAPKIDPLKIESMLTENSVIVDKDGTVIEKIQTEEFRSIVSIDKIPDHLENAFIAIEDERFETHIGVDPKGIIAALFDYVKNRGTLRGASTITQQLARNLYLSADRELDRKIKEAYLAIQIERVLTKDQILEAYLNRIYLGQGAYGVQEAAQTYFSKNVDELTIAESAMIAGVTKNPSRLPLYKLLKPEDVDDTKHYVVGQVDILSQRYTAIFNEEALERQKLILSQMHSLGYISSGEYEQAKSEDMKAAIKPGKKKMEGISSYFTDYVKSQVINDLVSKAGYTREDAERELYTGGLKIYSTMDIDMQHKLENIYDNFSSVLFGDTSQIKGPMLIDWTVDKYKNIVDDNRSIVYYEMSNILDSNSNLVIENGTYNITEEGNLVINNKKLNIYPKTIDIADYYSIDEKKNLVTHTIGSLSLPENSYSVDENKQLIIMDSFLSNNKDFYSVDENSNLNINSNYFYTDSKGIVQPQSSTVIIDYRTGEIKALVGGRDIEGSRIFNRALAQRQPGSAIKPLAVYLPALDNGFTAADVIDDIPHYDNKGNLWPRNWYDHQQFKYWGLNTLRQSVEQSINVNSVKVLESIGVDVSIEYLMKLGIIKENDNGSDSFVTRSENQRINDENLSALAVGGMSKGLTPLEMTAAFGAIANNGIFTEPIAYLMVQDRDGNVILENKPNKVSVVTDQVAYIMTDILRSTVTSGLANSAKISNGNASIPVAGKTGTTQDKGDIWFVGYTPYYVTGVWIGNDLPQVKLSSGSSIAAKFWSSIMKEVHDGYEPKDFDIPQGLVYKQICTESGKLATELCALDPRGSTVRSEVFIKGTEPTEFCDIHVKVAIDTSTNKLATENCPPELIEERVFIKREPPYNPEEHGGLVPADYQYTVPTEECDIHEEEKNIFDDWLDDWFNDGWNYNENQPDEQDEQVDESSEF